MIEFESDIRKAIDDFFKASELAGFVLWPEDLGVEFHPAPHQPSKLPTGKMAVYGFWHEGRWLKIGQAGPKSNARFQSHHYNPKSSNSNLAKSIIRSEEFVSTNRVDKLVVGNWIKSNCCRVNIFFDRHRKQTLLSFLEAFLHLRLDPRFER